MAVAKVALYFGTKVFEETCKFVLKNFAQGNYKSKEIAKSLLAILATDEDALGLCTLSTEYSLDLTTVSLTSSSSSYKSLYELEVGLQDVPVNIAKTAVVVLLRLSLAAQLDSKGGIAGVVTRGIKKHFEDKLTARQIKDVLDLAKSCDVETVQGGLRINRWKISPWSTSLLSIPWLVKDDCPGWSFVDGVAVLYQQEDLMPASLNDVQLAITMASALGYTYKPIERHENMMALIGGSNKIIRLLLHHILSLLLENPEDQVMIAQVLMETGEIVEKNTMVSKMAAKVGGLALNISKRSPSVRDLISANKMAKKHSMQASLMNKLSQHSVGEVNEALKTALVYSNGTTREAIFPLSTPTSQAAEQVDMLLIRKENPWQTIFEPKDGLDFLLCVVACQRAKLAWSIIREVYDLRALTNNLIYLVIPC